MSSSEKFKMNEGDWICSDSQSYKLKHNEPHSTISTTLSLWIL
ncbi:hypothetical protein NPIL_640551, partial [Nephila pilipes]